MSTFRIRQAAEILGVSDDTLRRWATSGKVPVTVDDEDGRQVIEGAALARFAEEHAATLTRPDSVSLPRESARNHFVGLVTRVIKDTVMAQVEVQSGVNRIVSLMSREAADDLGLEPGVLAIASVKSTNVVIELPHPRES